MADSRFSASQPGEVETSPANPGDSATTGPADGLNPRSDLPYGRQEITRADLAAVETALGADFITQGPGVAAFEAKLAAGCQAGHAVAVNSATSALHIACLALQVGPGDLVWTSPLSFVASANCVRYCGADVGFVDVDPRTGNLSVAALQARLLAAERAGERLPKVVIPVHLAGQPCDMQGIAHLASRFGFRVIEDASHAIGAHYRGEPVGSGRYSDITVFSFHPVKIVTTAEGGAALTNDPLLCERMLSLRSHGIDKSARMLARHPQEPWFYEQTQLGFNYRLTDVQAALGVSQLDRLEAYIDHRHRLVNRYAACLAGLPLRLPVAEPDSRSSWHLYAVNTLLSPGSVCVPAVACGEPDPASRQPASPDAVNVAAARRLSLFRSLRSQGIGVAVHYIPIHTQPYYHRLGFRPGDFPAAEAFYAGTLSLPVFGSMSFSEQDRVVAAIARWAAQDDGAGASLAA